MYPRFEHYRPNPYCYGYGCYGGYGYNPYFYSPYYNNYGPLLPPRLPYYLQEPSLLPPPITPLQLSYIQNYTY